MSTYTLLHRNHNHRYHQDHHVISNQQNIACHTAHSNIHCQTNNHACEPEVNITSNHHAKEVSKLCACKQKHSSVKRLTETDQIQIRDDTTSRACLRTPCYTGITTSRYHQDHQRFPTNKTIACHTAHSNIHWQTNNHACEPEVNITSNHHAKRSFFCKLCACKQKHSSVVGRLTETDQIQIRDDTTSRACLRTSVTPESQPPLPPGSSEISNHQNNRVPYSTFKYPLSNKQPCM